jgi:hypothetical protein
MANIVLGFQELALGATQEFLMLLTVVNSIKAILK